MRGKTFYVRHVVVLATQNSLAQQTIITIVLIRENNNLTPLLLLVKLWNLSVHRRITGKQSTFNKGDNSPTLYH